MGLEGEVRVGDSAIKSRYWRATSGLETRRSGGGVGGRRHGRRLGNQEAVLEGDVKVRDSAIGMLGSETRRASHHFKY